MCVIINLLDDFPSKNQIFHRMTRIKKRVCKIKRFGLFVDKAKYARARARANMRDIFSLSRRNFVHLTLDTNCGDS